MQTLLIWVLPFWDNTRFGLFSPVTTQRFDRLCTLTSHKPTPKEHHPFCRGIT
jgi:hypothetical protein